MINVLVAEDSAVSRELITGILNAEPGIRVVAATDNGSDAVELTRRLRPDVVAMDVLMPCLDGFAATQAIMRTAPTPTLLMSNYFDSDRAIFHRNAARAHAWAVVPKPPAPDAQGFDAVAGRLVQLVKEAASSGVPTDGGQADEHPVTVQRRSIVIGVGLDAGSICQLVSGVPPATAAAVVLLVDDPAAVLDDLRRRTDVPVLIPHAPASLYPGIVYLLPFDRLPSFRCGSDFNVLATLRASRRCTPARVLECVADGLGAAAVVVIRGDTRRELGSGLAALRLAGTHIVAAVSDDPDEALSDVGRRACGWADELVHAAQLGSSLGAIIAAPSDFGRCV